MENTFNQHVYDALSLLIQNYNDLALKVIAAERILARQNRSVFEDYLTEKTSVERELKLRAPLEVLAPLRNSL